jgi:hypothetical protein
MQHDSVLQDSTAPVINVGMTAKKGGSRKHKKPVEEVDGSEQHLEAEQQEEKESLWWQASLMNLLSYSKMKTRKLSSLRLYCN